MHKLSKNPGSYRVFQIFTGVLHTIGSENLWLKEDRTFVPQGMPPVLELTAVLRPQASSGPDPALCADTTLLHASVPHLSLLHFPPIQNVHWSFRFDQKDFPPLSNLRPTKHKPHFFFMWRRNVKSAYVFLKQEVSTGAAFLSITQS